MKTNNFFQKINSRINNLIQQKNIRDKIICKKGCTICCEKVNIFVLPQEIFLIVNALNKLPFNKRKEIAKRIKKIDEEWDKNVKNKGTHRITGETAENLINEMVYGIRYRCPLLFEKICIIYENRPVVCRSYFSDNLESCREENPVYNLADEALEEIKKVYLEKKKDFPLIPLFRNIDFKNNKFVVINEERIRQL